MSFFGFKNGKLVPVLVCICPRFQGSVVFRNRNNRKTQYCCETSIIQIQQRKIKDNFSVKLSKKSFA